MFFSTTLLFRVKSRLAEYFDYSITYEKIDYSIIFDKIDWFEYFW